jgi:chromosomal replication initiator protein
MNAWELIKQKLAARLTAESFENWFGRTSLRDAQGDSIWVGVPSEAVKQYIETELDKPVWSAVQELRLPLRRIFYEVTRSAGGNGNGTAAAVALAEPEFRLNPKFTFENFVVGACNQFAHAAAKSVVEKPASDYNPLYIYGGVGLGKTHLTHAIGRALVDRNPSLRVVYTTAERFMNEMITCIKQGRIALFHAKYRTADVLLVDDVHILGGKDATQDEFFFTFNELYEGQRQVVLTSDSPPNQITGLVERLRSRFSSGLMVDIQPPDLETKMAILEKKAEAEGIDLPSDVRNFLATKTRTNIRELTGALTKLSMQSSLTGEEISLAMAHQALKHLAPNGDKRISLDSIIKAVAADANLNPAQLKQKTNERRISRPRQIAMYLAKQLTHASLPEIGRALGGKHHTTVLHAIDVVERLRQTDAELNNRIHGLMDSLQ